MTSLGLFRFLHFLFVCWFVCFCFEFFYRKRVWRGSDWPRRRRARPFCRRNGPSSRGCWPKSPAWAWRTTPPRTGSARRTSSSCSTTTSCAAWKRPRSVFFLLSSFFFLLFFSFSLFSSSIGTRPTGNLGPQVFVCFFLLLLLFFLKDAVFVLARRRRIRSRQLFSFSFSFLFFFTFPNLRKVPHRRRCSSRS